jgi:transposase
MPTRPSIEKLLARKQAVAEHRLQRAKAAVIAAEQRVAEIEEARAVLDKSGGRLSTVRNVIGEVRLTNADIVLELLQRRRKKGWTRIELAEALQDEYDHDLTLNAISTYLSRLSAAGLAEFDGDVWRPIIPVQQPRQEQH